jgi:hypothetical protein
MALLALVLGPPLSSGEEKETRIHVFFINILNLSKNFRKLIYYGMDGERYMKCH